MSNAKSDELERLEFAGNNIESRAKDDHFVNEPQGIHEQKEKETHNLNHLHSENVDNESTLLSCQGEEEIIQKKYGGLLVKKHPLISKDHERAFFDSADWALNKQGSRESKDPLVSLLPKLEPSPHQQLRSRAGLAYARIYDTEVDDESNAENVYDGQSSKLNSAEAEKDACADKS